MDFCCVFLTIVFVVFDLYKNNCFAVHREILNLYHNKFSGDGTYYSLKHGQQGLCQFGPHLPPVAKNSKIKARVALNAQQFFNSSACGICIHVRAPGKGFELDPIQGDFIAFVDNLCPECQTGSLDFLQKADGRWQIEIQAVQCPVGQTKLEYKFQGSNQWYIKFQVRNARIPVTAVSLFQPGLNHWAPLQHTTDGHWVMGTNLRWEEPVPTPMHIRLMAANGQTVNDVIKSFENDVIIKGDGVQLPVDETLPLV